MIIGQAMSKYLLNYLVFNLKSKDIHEYKFLPNRILGCFAHMNMTKMSEGGKNGTN